MISTDSYADYFRHQCKAHPDLLHLDEPGKRVFDMVDVDKVLGDYRQDIQDNPYIFRLFTYSFEVRGSGHNGVKHPDAGFMIAKFFSPRVGHACDYIQAMADSERVGLDIIGKMVTDSRAGHPLFRHVGDGVDGLGVFAVPKMQLGDTGYAGWIFTFRLSSFLPLDTSCSTAPAWRDGGQTPFA